MSWKLLDRPSYFGLSQKQLQTLYLVAATGLAALVPIIFLAGYWIQSELGKGRRDLDVFLGARTYALSQRVDAEIERQLSALHALAALPSLDQDVDRFEAAVRRVTAQMPRWTGLSLVAPDGKVAFSTTDPPMTIDRGLLSRVVSGKKARIETTGEAGGGILLYEPVLRDGAMPHVLVLWFDGGRVRDIVSEASEHGLTSLLLDRHGRILAGPAERDASKSQIEPDLLRRVQEAPAGLFRRTSQDGEPTTTAFSRSALTEWTTVVSISRSRSDLLFSRPVWATIGAGTLGLLLAGILAVFVTHNFMERKVSEERLAASRALGELDARLLATSRDALEDQQKAASEREVLLREVYHRVKNNLQIVQSLLRLGSRDLTPDQREPFENAVRRIGAMARVHTLLYNSPDLASIDFRDYLDELIRDLRDGLSGEARSIRAEFRAAPMRLPLDTAIPLAFVAVEILTNAFKHAFPSGGPGLITVEIEPLGEHAILRIKDNGVGLGESVQTKGKLGLTIVRKLVQQIDGEIEEPPPGSSAFIVRFPTTPTKADASQADTILQGGPLPSRDAASPT